MVKKLQENKFGEFDSCDEINELVENLFNEGDIESIYTVAAENGISETVMRVMQKFNSSFLFGLTNIQKLQQRFKMALSLMQNLRMM